MGTSKNSPIKGYRSQIHRKGTRGKALTANEKTRQPNVLYNALPSGACICLDGAMGG
jgi:hypothetical protein